MPKPYFLNKTTHRIHIYGMCPSSKSKPYDIEWFDTEDEALAYDGRAAGLCKKCRNKRLAQETDNIKK